MELKSNGMNFHAYFVFYALFSPSNSIFVSSINEYLWLNTIFILGLIWDLMSHTRLVTHILHICRKHLERNKIQVFKIHKIKISTTHKAFLIDKSFHQSILLCISSKELYDMTNTLESLETVMFMKPIIEKKMSQRHVFNYNQVFCTSLYSFRFSSTNITMFFLFWSQNL